MVASIVPSQLYSPYIPLQPMKYESDPTRSAWMPFFAILPKRTLGGKLRIGKLFRQEEVHEDWTDFSVVERTTITRYATEKEAFIWNLKNHV